jgi:CheY-like chemotaxis protein
MVNPLRILLVDDDPAGAELTAAALKSIVTGAHVHFAGDGEEALQHLLPPPGDGEQRERPHVVLLDLKMPKIDGHEVLRRARAEPALARTRFVVLTSSDRESDIARSRELGADAHVVKPVAIDELIARLRALTHLWEPSFGAGVDLP